MSRLQSFQAKFGADNGKNNVYLAGSCGLIGAASSSGMHVANRTEMISAVAGAIAGLAATTPMTLTMLALRRLLPPHERYEVPPTEITRELDERTPNRAVLREPELTAAATIAHLGYGASTGAVYGLITKKSITPNSKSGIAFGLAVWAGSYLGWLPAFGMRAGANRQPGRRNAMMVLSHVVWGAVLGALCARLRE